MNQMGDSQFKFDDEKRLNRSEQIAHSVVLAFTLGGVVYFYEDVTNLLLRLLLIVSPVIGIMLVKIVFKIIKK